MTAIDERLASVTELRPARQRAPRRKSPTVAVVPPVDDRARLTAEFNRVLDTHLSTEMSGRDALGDLVGTLLDAAGKSLPEPALIAVAARTAGKLGCPPVDAPRAVCDRFAAARVAANVDALMDVFLGAEDLLSRIVAEAGNANTLPGTSSADAALGRLRSLVEDLAAEYSIGVTR